MTVEPDARACRLTNGKRIVKLSDLDTKFLSNLQCNFYFRKPSWRYTMKKYIFAVFVGLLALVGMIISIMTHQHLMTSLLLGFFGSILVILGILGENNP